MLFITQKIKKLGTLSVVEWSMLKTGLLIGGIFFAKLFPVLLTIDWPVLIVLMVVLYAIPAKKILS